MKEEEKTKTGGVPTNALLLPLEIGLAVLLILIAILVHGVNQSSNSLSDLIERTGAYPQEVMNLHAGINTLSETAINFIQNPVAEDGSPSVGPLMAYAQELGNDRRGPAVAERFRSYGVSDEAQSFIDHAAETSEAMLAVQLHALALMRSVYPLPPIPALDVIPDVPLTREELAMSEEERVELARRMIQDESYSHMKYYLSEDVTNANRILQQDSARTAAETRQHVAALRAGLWAVICGIAVMAISAFLVLRFWVVKPLRRHTEEISANESMQQTSGIREMRVLVNAYNSLLSRRNKLESILRSAAETDALTGLPNRYSLEHYVLENGESGGAMAVLVFDVNYLKQVNDTQGHLEGDKLIRTAGECIRECFGAESCYRYGGDEFTAVLRDCDEEDIRRRLDRFDLALEREHISISVGYAYAAETEEGTFRTLLNEADGHMYEKKKQLHGLEPDGARHT